MAASHNDSYQLSQSGAFQNRVQISLVAACVAISTEGWAVPFHRERATFAAVILSAVGTEQGAFAGVFAITAATDPTCLSDATQAGTVILTAGNVAAQQALVTDAHIDAAVSAQFNSFIKVPGN